MEQAPKARRQFHNEDKQKRRTVVDVGEYIDQELSSTKEKRLEAVNLSEGLSCRHVIVYVMVENKKKRSRKREKRRGFLALFFIV